MKTYDMLRYIHVLAGAVALVTFWIAASLRKGSVNHIGVGRWYLFAMLAIMGTALPMSAFAFANSSMTLGIFLAYLVLITGTACWTAWRAIRDKHDIQRFAGPVFRVLAVVNIVAGTAVMLLGVKIKNPILIGLSLVGLISGPAMLMFARRKPADRRWWIAQHYSGIIGAGVATHVAFLSLGLTRLLPPQYASISQLAGWSVPIAASLIARVWLSRKYGSSPNTQGARVSRAGHPA